MCDVPPEAWEDHFHPPSISTIVSCLHCQEVYDSYKMVWETRPVDDETPGDLPGFWRCPVEGCDGAGFGFDIFPIDPDYIDPDGREMGQWVEFDDDEYDEEDYDADNYEEFDDCDDLPQSLPEEVDSQLAADIEHDLNIIVNMLEENSAFDQEQTTDEQLPWTDEEFDEWMMKKKQQDDPFLSPKRDLFFESDG